MRTVISWITINEEKELLLVNKKWTWILPWGKVEAKENDIDTLHREISEELQVDIDASKSSFYKEFEWTSPFLKKQTKVKTYFTELLGDCLEQIQPAHEICDVAWKKSFDDITISSITRDIIQALQEDGYLEMKEE